MKVRYRQFHVRVAAARQLSPSFLRITFTGDDLAGFGCGGYDQRLKIILPAAGGTLTDMPSGDDWYDRWRALPNDRRPVLRTYTVRAARPEQAQVDVDFVLHGDVGPASRWAAAARPGDEAMLLGPDRPGTGRPWGCEWSPPDGARRLLLAGDETAVPAVSAVLECLPATAPVTALLEVPSAADALDIAAPGADVRWLPRDGGGHGARTADGGHAAHGARLAHAVREIVAGWVAPSADSGEVVDIDVDNSILWEVPDAEAPSDGLYVWLAGEAAVVQGLRRYLVGELCLPRGAVAFMGYWRRGRPEPN